MEERVYLAEVVTPLLVHGADPRSPELRAPSFKGGLRFMARAIWGKRFDLQSVARLDAHVFGSTESASSVKIRLRWSDSGASINRYNLSCHRWAPCAGYRPGRSFEIGVLFRDERVKRVFEELLMLFSALGGFGRRWRLGYGVVLVTRAGASGKLAEIPLVGILGRMADASEVERWINKRVEVFLEESENLLKKVEKVPAGKVRGAGNRRYPVLGGVCVLSLKEPRWEDLWNRNSRGPDKRLCAAIGQLRRRGDVSVMAGRGGRRRPWHVFFRPHLRAKVLVVWWTTQTRGVTCGLIRQTCAGRG